MNSSAKRWVMRSYRVIPEPVLPRLERMARLGQGKGWGAGTVAQEVRAARSLLLDGDRDRYVVLDVGANVGAWTAGWLDVLPDSLVFAFEPSSDAFSKLQASLGADGRVRLIKSAVGARGGVGTLWADKPGSALGSMTKRRLDHLGLVIDHSEEVPLVTLDAWCAEMGVHPNVVKLDVEGHELEVLRGAGQTLESVQVVQFEFGGCNIDTRTYFQDFYYFFRDAGFRLLRLGPKGLLPVDRYQEADEAFTTTNYFAQRL